MKSTLLFLFVALLLISLGGVDAARRRRSSSQKSHSEPPVSSPSTPVGANSGYVSTSGLPEFGEVPDSIRQDFDRAKSQVLNGDLRGALATLQRLGKQDAVAVHHLLAEVQLRMGGASEAEESIRKAISLSPNDRVLQSSLAAMLSRSDRRAKEAKKIAEPLLKDDPKNPELLSVIGNVYLHEKNLPGARTALLEALRLWYPDGILETLTRNPVCESARVAAMALVNTCQTIQDYDCMGYAMFAYGVFENSPLHLENAAASFSMTHQPDKFSTVVDRMIELDSANGMAYYMKGYHYQLFEMDNQKAVEHYAKAIEHGHETAALYNNMGAAYYDLRQPSHILPNYIKAYELGDDGAILNLAHSLKLTCTYKDYDKYFSVYTRHIMNEAPGPVYKSLVLPTTAEQVLANARNKTKELREEVHLKVRTEPRLRPIPELALGRERVRVGFLSADFNDAHPVGRCVKDMFQHLDPSRIEVFVYTYNKPGVHLKTSKVLQAIERHAEHYLDITKLSVSALAETINSHRIHVLYDFLGWTLMHRLESLSFHPAHTQVNVLGFASTTGTDFIDYMVGDRITAPPELEHLFTEKIIRFPQSYHLFPTPDFSAVQPMSVEERKATRREFGLPEDGVVIAYFNKLLKMDRDIVYQWMHLLAETPNSVLWLLRNWSASECEDKLREEAASFGVARDRIVFLDWLPADRHMQVKSVSDFFLDSVDCNAHTTAVDALVVGVPVVTMAADKFCARVGASIAVAAGLPHHIVHSRKEYDDVSKELAADPIVLGSAREKVAAATLSSANTLWDAAAYASHLTLAAEEIAARAAAQSVSISASGGTVVWE
eukprot:Rmarinus@m.1224